MTVTTTSNGHLPPEHWAERATNHIVHVGEGAHPAIADQAKAFKETVCHVINYYIRVAIKEDRSQVVTMLRSSGQGDLANSVEKL